MRGAIARGLIVVAALIVTPRDIGAWAQGVASVPADFKLRLVSARRGPARIPPDIQWVEISAAGSAKLSEMRSGNAQLPGAVIRLGADAVQRIYRAVSTERFFELQGIYQDSEVSGGDFAEMTITADGKTQTVKTVNIRVAAFDRITQAVNSALPADRRIRYNALHVDSYKSVDR